MQLQNIFRSFVLGGIIIALISSCTQKPAPSTSFSMVAEVTDADTGIALLYTYNNEANKIDTVSYSIIENGRFTFDSARFLFEGPAKLTLLIKPTKKGTGRSEYSKKNIIVEYKPLTGKFGVFDGVCEIPESKYNDLIANIDSHYPTLKAYKDSLANIRKQYRQEFTEQEKKDRLKEVQEIIREWTDSYKEALTEIVYKQYEETDDIIYKGLLLDVFSNVFEMADFVTQADIILPQFDKTSITYKDIEAQRKTYEQVMAVEAGNNFIDFDLNDLEGNTIKLSDVVKNNEYVLLDFWASWCGPCRADMPKLRKVYAEYHPKGFEIFMVSIDTKKDKWVKAEEEEALVWNSTLDSKKVKDLYGVTFIPQNFLISKSGEIVAVNLRGEALGEKLDEVLN